ncbi:MAG: TIR domain-containing protein [Kofleriaceae bacterium]|nr:TIR domain-containing protein [Kofleriaceae bacterium]MBP9168189.1 TIR domain-containing protein [Kofleriaceae bacterium]MBP9856433.1 TIR domain-containing protein [Kofleriaceae bacterium]
MELRSVGARRAVNLVMSARHKVFVSYHHANDQNYKEIFDHRFGNKFGILQRGAVNMGDIDAGLNTEAIRQKIRDEYLHDCSVTVVLVGVDTWRRKYVDWEIGATLRHTVKNPRGGLVGIFLPSYQQAHRDTLRARKDGAVASYDQYTIPPRLHDNVGREFASLHLWSNDPEEVQGWIHDAYNRKSRIDPDNSRESFANNRSGTRWY